MSTGETSPDEPRFPPLMSTLDVYMDSASDARYQKVVDGVNAQKRRFKKSSRKAVTKRGGVGSTLSPVIAPPLRELHSIERPESRVVSEEKRGRPRVGGLGDGGGRRGLMVGLGSESLSMDASIASAGTWDAPHTYSHAPRVADLKSHPPLSAPPHRDRDGDGDKGFSPGRGPIRGPFPPSPRPHQYVQSNGSYVQYGSPVPISQQSRLSPGRNGTPPRTDLGFSKAVESIAAIKLHNYAMRRREHVNQKLRLLKEVKGYQAQNERDAERVFGSARVLAAWKLRYYVEFIRLSALRKVAHRSEQERQQLEQQCAVQMQALAAAHVAEAEAAVQSTYLSTKLTASQGASAAHDEVVRDLKKSLRKAEDLVKKKAAALIAAVAEVAQVREDHELAMAMVREEHELVRARMRGEHELVVGQVQKEHERGMAKQAADSHTALESATEHGHRTLARESEKHRAVVGGKEESVLKANESAKAAEERMLVLQRELEITRLTCQTLVRSVAVKDDSAEDMGSQLGEMRLRTAELAVLLEMERQRTAEGAENASMGLEDGEILLQKMGSVVDQLGAREKSFLTLQGVVADLRYTEAKLRDDLRLEGAALVEKETALREARHARSGLEQLTSELASKLHSAAERVVCLEGVESQLSADLHSSREGVADLSEKVQSLEEKLASTQGEVEFLVDENGELGREIECHLMQVEDVQVRRAVLFESAERQHEYSRFLEEELFDKRKMYSKPGAGEGVSGVSGGGWGESESYSYTSYDQGKGKGKGRGKGKVEEGVEEGDKWGDEGGDGGEGEGRQMTSFNASPSPRMVVHLNGMGSVGSPARSPHGYSPMASGYSPMSMSGVMGMGGSMAGTEVRMLKLMDELEARMRRMEGGDAEKGQGTGGTGTIGAMSSPSHSLSQGMGGMGMGMVTKGADSGQQAQGQTAQEQETQEQGLDKPQHIEQHIEMERLFIKLQGILDLTLSELAAQQAQVSHLQEQRAQCKDRISGAKKSVRRQSKKISRNNNEGDGFLAEGLALSEGEVGAMEQEGERLKVLISASKGAAMETNSKAVVLETQLYDLDQNLESSAHNFQSLYGAPVTDHYPADLVHLLVEQTDMQYGDGGVGHGHLGLEHGHMHPADREALAMGSIDDMGSMGLGTGSQDTWEGNLVGGFNLEAGSSVVAGGYNLENGDSVVETGEFLDKGSSVEWEVGALGGEGEKGGEEENGFGFGFESGEGWGEGDRGEGEWGEFGEEGEEGEGEGGEESRGRKKKRSKSRSGASKSSKQSPKSSKHKEGSTKEERRESRRESKKERSRSRKNTINLGAGADVDVDADADADAGVGMGGTGVGGFVSGLELENFGGVKWEGGGEGDEEGGGDGWPDHSPLSPGPDRQLTFDVVPTSVLTFTSSAHAAPFPGAAAYATAPGSYVTRMVARSEQLLARERTTTLRAELLRLVSDLEDAATDIAFMEATRLQLRTEIASCLGDTSRGQGQGLDRLREQFTALQVEMGEAHERAEIQGGGAFVARTALARELELAQVAQGLGRDIHEVREEIRAQLVTTYHIRKVPKVVLYDALTISADNTLLLHGQSHGGHGSGGYGGLEREHVAIHADAGAGADAGADAWAGVDAEMAEGAGDAEAEYADDPEWAQEEEAQERGRQKRLKKAKSEKKQQRRARKAGGGGDDDSAAASDMDSVGLLGEGSIESMGGDGSGCSIGSAGGREGREGIVDRGDTARIADRGIAEKTGTESAGKAAKVDIADSGRGLSREFSFDEGEMGMGGIGVEGRGLEGLGMGDMGGVGMGGMGGMGGLSAKAKEIALSFGEYTNADTSVGAGVGKMGKVEEWGGGSKYYSLKEAPSFPFPSAVGGTGGLAGGGKGADVGTSAGASAGAGTSAGGGGESRASLLQEQAKLRRKLRTWNATYMKENGIRPAAGDFDSFGEEVKAMLFRKNQIKQALAEMERGEGGQEQDDGQDDELDQKVKGPEFAVDAGVSVPAAQAAPSAPVATAVPAAAALAAAGLRGRTAPPTVEAEEAEEVDEKAVLWSGAGTGMALAEWTGGTGGTGGAEGGEAVKGAEEGGTVGERPDMKAEYNRLKKTMKKWSKSFSKKKGREATPEDYAESIKPTADRMAQLKKLWLEGGSVESGALALSAPSTPYASPAVGDRTRLATSPQEQRKQGQELELQKILEQEQEQERKQQLQEQEQQKAQDQQKEQQKHQEQEVGTPLPNPAHPALQKEYSMIKKSLKKWQKQFQVEHGREPIGDDFDTLDEGMKGKIERKFQLKELLGKGIEV